jgi:hypothetical protein
MLTKSLKSVLKVKHFSQAKYTTEILKEIESCLKISNPTESSIKALNNFNLLKIKNEKLENSTIELLINIFHKNKFHEQIYEIYEFIRQKEFELFSEETM